jgi:MSHA biogenesis protein MshP
MNNTHASRRRAFHATQLGFSSVAAIMVVLMLATLGAAMMRLTWTQQTASALDSLGAQALQAANAGTEWGMFQALRNASCAGSTTLDLTRATGFKVTVSCTTSSYSEGQDASSANATVQLYVIDAVACNGSGAACPATDGSSTGLNYVERRRQSVVSRTDNGF